MNDLSWNEIRQRVYERADGCCEYCRTCEVNTGQTMQVDHIDPNGGDDLDNLGLSCWNCNNHKHQATHATDPETDEVVSLFNPRKQIWSKHFAWINDATSVQGLTPTGRATAFRLKMNRPTVVVARSRRVKGGYHPPKQTE
jgi:5-methylcytosine-specific restriction endonuclease McrA